MFQLLLIVFVDLLATSIMNVPNVHFRAGTENTTIEVKHANITYVNGIYTCGGIVNGRYYFHKLNVVSTPLFCLLYC